MKTEVKGAGLLHASHRKHQRQRWTRVLLPVILAALLLVGVVVLISISAFGNGGDLDRWTAIATIWLTLPVLVIEAVLLVGLGAIVYAFGRLGGLIPPYTLRAQILARQFERGTKRAGEMIRQPMLGVRALAGRVRSAITGKSERT